MGNEQVVQVYRLPFLASEEAINGDRKERCTEASALPVSLSSDTISDCEVLSGTPAGGGDSRRKNHSKDVRESLD